MALRAGHRDSLPDALLQATLKRLCRAESLADLATQSSDDLDE
jgi:hypothetical protein